ncbi:MAG: hypothetical protein HYW50_04500, partial [Candidatus Diapherotrites archaeon]|nr:hypothetical protein [Candidatus Diapherotrites archaeon]
PIPANPTTIEQRKYNPSYIDGQNVPVRTGSAQSYPSALEKGGCGTVDTISDLAPATIEKDGLKIFLSVVNGKEIQASIDAAEWRKKGKPAVDIRENVLVTGNREVPAVSDRVTIPFSICLKQGETAVEPPDREPPIIDPNLGAVCPNGGKTGNEVFEGFGFDKILLDWRVEKVEENACLGAKGANYCDAVQFSIALNKKAGKIKELLEGLDESKCAVEGKEKCAEAQKNSTELFRFLGKTMQVANNAKQIGAANEKYLFFQNTDGTLLKNTEVEQEISKELDELKRTISSSSDNSRVISSTKSLLESLSKNQKTLNGTLIFGLIANDPKALGKKKADGKLEFEEQLKEIGILSDTIEGKTNYIITFEEFKKFFENLDKASGEGAKACETPTENKNCTMDEKNVRIEEIAVLEGNKNGTEITVQFLNDFLKSIKDFGVGVRSREQMNEQEKETVMKSIKNFGAKGYEDFFSFYSENIGFNANLIKDGFSDDFRSDFEKEYSSKELIAGDFFDEEQSNPQWEFEIKGTQEKELSDSGEFKTTIAYDWSKGKNNAPQITIELELSKPLAEISEHYAKNPLFYFPVDGTVGLENEAVQREGYGIRIPPGNFPQEFLRFNHYSEQEAQLEPFLYFTQKSTSEWKQRFDPNYSGEILKISREQVQFTPTDPIGVELTIRKTTPQSEPAGMLYSLQDGTNHVSAQSLLKWKFEKDEIGKRSEGAYSDSRFERSILCGTGNGDPRNGFVIANGGSGETVMKTVIYVPTRFGGKVSDSALNIDCIKDQATLARYIDRASGNTDAKLLRIGENILNNSNTQRLLEAYTLKNLLEMVKDNSRLVCAKVENKQLSLVWNEEQALKFGTG